MPDPTAGTPRTEAGRALLRTLVAVNPEIESWFGPHIAQVEAEASGTGLDATGQFYSLEQALAIQRAAEEVIHQKRLDAAKRGVASERIASYGLLTKAIRTASGTGLDGARQRVVDAARRYREAEDIFVASYASADGKVADAAMGELRNALDALAALDTEAGK